MDARIMYNRDCKSRSEHVGSGRKLSWKAVVSLLGYYPRQLIRIELVQGR